MTSVSALTDETDIDDGSDTVDHRIVGARLRPVPSAAVVAKSVAAGVAAGLPEDLAEALAHGAADHQQLRRALRAPKIQRFGTDEFTYIECDVLTWRIVPSPDNIRFEGEHARGTIPMPRFGAADDRPLLTFGMDSAEDMIDAMEPRIDDMAAHNPHVGSIQDRGIETPGWLSFVELDAHDVGPVITLESTDGFGRTVAVHKGLGISFKDAAWNLRPGTRRAASLQADLAGWASSEFVTDAQARKVRCSIMPNARVIIHCKSERRFDRARRRLVAHLHMAPPMNFTVATTLNAKANAAVDNLYERALLRVPDGLTLDRVRDILDGTERGHGLRDDEVAVMACGALNPQQNTVRARAVNDAVLDLTGAKPKLDERTQLAAEVALRGFPADKRLTRLRSALERAWRWAQLRDVELTRQPPLELLTQALRELVHRGDKAGHATAELAALASYHLVTAPTQLLARSDYGSQGSNTEPQQILSKLAKSDAGLRQLCQIVLDGRGGREPQELPDDSHPTDERVTGAESLTLERLRELAELSESKSVTHQSPEELFALAIDSFSTKLEDLRLEATRLGEVVDDDNVPLVDTKGLDASEAIKTLREIEELATEWRGTQRRAARMRADLVHTGPDSEAGE